MNPRFFVILALSAAIGWLVNDLRGAIWGMVIFVTFSLVVDFLDYVLNAHKYPRRK